MKPLLAGQLGSVVAGYADSTKVACDRDREFDRRNQNRVRYLKIILRRDRWGLTIVRGINLLLSRRLLFRKNSYRKS